VKVTDNLMQRTRSVKQMKVMVAECSNQLTMKSRGVPRLWDKSNRSRTCIACRPCDYNRRPSQWLSDTWDIPADRINY